MSWQDIEHYLAAKAVRKLAFVPMADERINFSNYTQRYEVGAFLPVPAIVGTNQHELNVLGLQVSSEKLAVLTTNLFFCTVLQRGHLNFDKRHSRTT